MLQHFVFLKYQDETPAEHLDAFCEKMLALKKLIPEIESLEIGRDIIQAERSWDIILIMVFQSLETLEIYQKHADHQAVIQFNNPYVADVGAIDFEMPLT